MRAKFINELMSEIPIDTKKLVVRILMKKFYE